MSMLPETSNFRILMFPWLAHGHIFPFLELSKRILVRKNFHIHLCTTAVNFPSIQTFIRSNGLDRAVDLVELHLEPSPEAELPPHYHTTKNLPAHLIFTLLKAFQTSKSSFSDILAALRPDLVVYDVFQPWAPELAASRGIPAVFFSITGAATKAFAHHRYVRSDDGFPFPELCPEEHEISRLDALHAFCRDNVFGGDTDELSLKLPPEAVVLLKTGRGLEGKYIDYVSAACPLNLLPVGPLVAETNTAGEDEDSENLLLWLSSKPRHSTVYVSFGSECFLSESEIQEIATGLELSAINFIWVLRPPPGENAIALPEGFLDRVKNKGIVVSGWVAQTRILAHPSTGAFVSHCGWSSVTESIWFGVPVVCMPMKNIMFIDANFLVAAGAGVRIPRKVDYKGKDVAEVINEVVVGKSGAELRRRAEELSEKMRREEGPDIDAGGEYLWQLCLKNQVRVKHDN